MKKVATLKKTKKKYMSMASGGIETVLGHPTLVVDSYHASIRQYEDVSPVDCIPDLCYGFQMCVALLELTVKWSRPVTMMVTV